MLKYFNLKKIIKKNKYSLIVILFAFTVAMLLIYINSTANILGHSYRDTYLYLILALKFAGYNITGYNYVNYLSPLIPFLTAILFKLGFVSETSIFIVTGAFYTIGTIGLYYLLKLRFNERISAFGAILYGSLSINLMWTANGTLDIPSMALSILALYYFILAIEKKQRYFYLAFPLAALSFFAKFPGALIGPIMILYFLSKKDIFGNIKKYLKHGIGGIITACLLFIPFFGYYLLNNIPLGFLNQAEEISSKTTSATQVTNGTEPEVVKEVGNQLYYYIVNIPRFIYNPQKVLAYVVIIIGIIGISYGFYKLFKYLKESYTDNQKKIAISCIPKIRINKIIYYFILIISLIGIAISFFTAGKISFIINEGIFFLSIFLFTLAFNSIYYREKIKINTKLNKENNSENNKFKFFSYDIAMIGWFLAYLIFFSAHLTKVDRYFTALAPSFIFFISLGLNTITEKLEECSNKKVNEYNMNLHIKKLSLMQKIRNNLGELNEKFNLNKIIPILGICVLLISTGAYLSIDKHDSLVDNEKEATNWIIHNEPNYQSKIIWADRAPDYTWYLKTEIHYAKEPMNVNTLSKTLIKNNTDYYITLHKTPKIPGFNLIKTIGEVNIYQRDKY